jgi:isopenicillin N synthase-like dioxygenase
LTIHGRSRYPGLHIWARNTGKRIPVKFPPTGRYLLVQAGKQLEHLTGGLIKAGFHEVVVNESTVEVGVHLLKVFDMLSLPQMIEHRKEKFQARPLIRISSTFFWHLSSDYDLVPIQRLVAMAHALKVEGNEEDDVVYEPMKVGQQVSKYGLPIIPFPFL